MFLMSSIFSSPLPGAGLFRQAPRRSFNIPQWLKCAPFVGLHLACVGAFFTGVNTTALLLCGLTYFVRMFGITAGYHRYFAHRAYKTSRVGQFVLAWLGCSAVQKGPLWWAAHHRDHHRYSDTPADPHSPHQTSFWWSHVGWVLAKDREYTPWEQIRDWSVHPELRWLDRWHLIPGLVLALLCWLCAGWAGLFWGFVISTVLVYHATFSINSLSHLIGRRRYATDDESRNNLFLALITLGEGWHNNHHHYQSSANQGFFWWEIDISYSIIRLLSFLGLTWDLRKPGAKALAYRLIQNSTPTESEAATGSRAGGLAGCSAAMTLLKDSTS
jgi:stearoyl-CoA desaturase (delta-9 desaturase)